MSKSPHSTTLILIAAFTTLLFFGCEKPEKSFTQGDPEDPIEEEPENPFQDMGGIEKIAFVSSEYDPTSLTIRLPNGQLYIMDSNGKRCITPDTKGYLYPQFLPDGSKIVCESMRIHEDSENPSENTFEIFVMEVDGNHPLCLTKGLGGHYPIVSPDGSKIAFMSFRELNNDIYIMDVDGNNWTRLTSYQGGGNSYSVFT